MDAVCLHELGIQRHLVEQKRHERELILLRQRCEHVTELLSVSRAVVRRYHHADEYYARAGLLHKLDDALEVLLAGREWQPAQAVVSTELDDDDARLVRFEHMRQPCEPALRRFTAYAGVDDAVFVPLGGESLLEQAYPTFLDLQAVAGAQAVAEHDDGA